MPTESPPSLPRRLVHGVVSVGVLIVLSLYEGLLLLFQREVPDPELPETRAASSDGRLDVPRVDARDLSPADLRTYMRHSRPVILRDVDPGLLADAETAVAGVAPGMPQGRLLINVRVLPRLGALGRWIRAHTGRRPVYMARFSGSYKTCIAHIDSAPSYNFYYLRKGRKRVFIVPRQYNRHVQLERGYDSVFAGEDADDLEHLGWLDRVPGYYDFELEAGEVLLFHNSACLHKFSNLTEAPEVYTIRLFSMDAAPEILRNDVLNWKGAQFFATTLLTPTTVRDTYSV